MKLGMIELHLTLEEFRDLCTSVCVSVGEGQSGVKIGAAIVRNHAHGKIPEEGHSAFEEVRDELLSVGRQRTR